MQRRRVEQRCLWAVGLLDEQLELRAPEDDTVGASSNQLVDHLEEERTRVVAHTTAGPCTTGVTGSR